MGPGQAAGLSGEPVAGANNGLNTLQPYDVAMANDGTAYMGLQDNGEAKIEPDGSMYTIYGGDGGFTAVDPANSNIDYEEYTYGDIAVTTDGGKTWNGIQPANLTSSLFTTPFEMDPEQREPPDDRRARHRGDDRRPEHDARAAGRRSTTSAPSSTPATRARRRQPATIPTTSSPRSTCRSGPAARRPADRAEDRRSALQQDKGGDTVPGLDRRLGRRELPTQAPGTYNDYDVTIGPNDGDAAMNIDVSWADSADDWDLYLYRNDGGTLTLRRQLRERRHEPPST